MAQKLDLPKSEMDFRNLQDSLYQTTSSKLQSEELPRFRGILEVASSEPVILTAIHKLKANRGAETPGSDGESMRNNFLQEDYQNVMKRVQEAFKHYKPQPVRRVYIPKPGKTEKRPLGIPSTIDRIVQECIRMTIEPILEAQFFKHSYGFRPMRDSHLALNRVTDIVHKTGYHWIVEGDIKGFFDNVNHSLLLKQLWHMGIRDKRILMIIKEMLKAGIEGEIDSNLMGTPQGGIISPLLANVYLHSFDKWITREWENKRTRKEFGERKNFLQALHSSNLKPVYLVRYADDWVLITNSKENAEKWKWRAKQFLSNTLKIELSEEKTLITNIKVKPIHFVGFSHRVKRGKSRQGFVPHTKPDPKRLKAKVNELHRDLRDLKKLEKIKKGDGKEKLIHGINLINSKIRGLIEYYDVANNVYRGFDKYANAIRWRAYRSMKQYGVQWIPAKEVHNLSSIHSKYETTIPSVEYNGLWVGVTDLHFATWNKDKTKLKRPKETPYTREGRELYAKRTNKKPLKVRADEFLNIGMSMGTSQRLHKFKTGKISKRAFHLYNFEFYLNRPYAYNRDKGRCKVCGEATDLTDTHFHHISPKLPISLVNRVGNLATVHDKCHKMIHDGKDYSHLENKIWKKINTLRTRLVVENGN